MGRKLIIDGNAVYELDENCMLQKLEEEKKKNENKTRYNAEYRKARNINRHYDT